MKRRLNMQLDLVRIIKNYTLQSIDTSFCEVLGNLMLSMSDFVLHIHV